MRGENVIIKLDAFVDAKILLDKAASMKEQEYRNGDLVAARAELVSALNSMDD
jgi:hypothetical protein